MQAVKLIYDIRENFNIFCSPVIYPVIPKGQLLLRLIPTAAHNMKDIEETLDAFSSVYTRLNEGYYEKMELGAEVAAT